MSYEGDEEREIQRLWSELELPSGAWAELLDSQIVVQANPTHLHDVPGRVFVRTVPEPFEAFSERGIAIGPTDRPRPDVAIALAEDIPEYVRDWPASVVRAVVETVSAGRGAAKRDYEDKRAAYQRAGIPIYVIVDPRTGPGWCWCWSPGSTRSMRRARSASRFPCPSRWGSRFPRSRSTATRNDPESSTCSSPYPGLVHGGQRLGVRGRPDLSGAHGVEGVLGEAGPDLRESRCGHGDLQIAVRS